MKKIILSFITVLSVVSIAAGTTLALWSDSGQSSGNTFAAGTLDLKLSDTNETNTDNVTVTWSGSAMTPGGSTVTGNLLVRNIGNPAADHVHFTVGNTITEASSGVGTSSASPMDRNLQITALSFDGSSVLTYLTDVNGNGWIDLDDWEQTASPGLGDHDGSLVPSHGTLPLTDLSTDHTLSMTAQLNSVSPDANQGDSVASVITATLHQADGQ